MLPFTVGEGLQLPFSLREKGSGDEGQLRTNEVIISSRTRLVSAP